MYSMEWASFSIVLAQSLQKFFVLLGLREERPGPSCVGYASCNASPPPPLPLTWSFMSFHQVTCKFALMFVYAVDARQLKNLIGHFDANGLSEHVHGNTRRRPHNQTDGIEIGKIKEFIEQFADNHALLVDYQLTWTIVSCYFYQICQWVQCTGFMSESEQVSSVSHLDVWEQELCPYVASMKPANMPESVKSQRASGCSKDILILQRNSISTITNNVLLHYSFDYAQQVHYLFHAPTWSDFCFSRLLENVAFLVCRVRLRPPLLTDQWSKGDTLVPSCR